MTDILLPTADERCEIASDAEDERYPKSDWRYDVANGDTVLGYGEWLAHARERDGVEAQIVGGKCGDNLKVG